MSDLEFISITLRNYKSFGRIPTRFNLLRTGAILITGENSDNTSEGITSNGCGKSTIFDAICYALYDKTPSNISKDFLINNVNKRDMEVVLEFKKKGISYVITRARKTEHGTFVKLEKEGKDITLDSMSRTNELIISIIGIPFELFVQIISVSASHGVGYFHLPLRSGNGPSQIGIIEELFNLKTLTEKAEKLKEVIKKAKIRLENMNQRYELLLKERERHEKQLENARNRAEVWEKERVSVIEEIEENLSRIKGIDISAELERQEKIRKVRAEIRENKQLLKESISKRSSISDTLGRRQVELDKVKEHNCPFCGQSMPEVNSKMSELTTTITELLESISALDTDISELKQIEENLQEKYDQLESEVTCQDADELIRIQARQDTDRRRLQELKTATNPHLDTIKELETTELEDLKTDELNAAVRRFEHQRFLLKLLTKKDSFVRKTLLNRNIPYLNKMLDYYLKELGLRHRVEFTHELTASISQFGNPLDFGNLSHGQQARVNLALSLAFNDVLKHAHGSVNLLVMDEVTDVGLDNVGILAAARTIKKKAVTDKLGVFVISHKDEISTLFENKVIISMRDGFSQILEESF